MKRNVESLNEVLLQVTDKTPNKKLYRFLNYSQDDKIEEVTLTYKQFERKVRQIAAYLQQLDAAGQRALLLYPPSLDYIAAFFGCLLAGVIAVPVYVPMSVRQLDKLKHIADNCGARFILTTEFILSMAKTVEEFDAYFKNFIMLTTENIPEESHAIYRETEVKRESTAFLQYTSGSTANPRGVIVSHGNLLANLSLITRYFQLGHISYIHELSWLPPYHDMGLIGGILAPLYVNGSCTFMSPIDFLKKPLRWLQALSAYQCNISGGPNFAYDLCVKKITPADCESLDLGIWKIAFNGAEMIRPTTLEAFYQTYKPYGFKKETFYPCYGMAEATLLITGGEPDRLPTTENFDSDQLSNWKATTTQSKTEVTALVGSGTCPDSQEVRIVDPVTLEPCPDCHIGEIWVAGPSIASGYWNQPQDYISHTFYARTAGGEGPYLRTGDLGFLKERELFVTGRLKDMIIVRGRNLYPHDIEDSIAAVHPACRPGCGVAFGIEVDGREEVVAVQEIHKAYTTELDLKWLGNEINSQISEKHGIALHKLVLIRHGSIPKTSSGKLQRNECRTAYISGKLKRLLSARNTVSGGSPPPCDNTNPAMNKNIAESQLDAKSKDKLNAGDIARWLSDDISRQLNIKVEEVDNDAPLVRYVPSSLDVVTLSGKLEQWIGRQIPPTLFYDYPTIALLAEKLAGAEPSAAKPDDPNRFEEEALPSKGLDQGIAIIGMGCRFPGGVRTPDQFWKMLNKGVHAVRKFPPDRHALAPEDRGFKEDRLNTAATYGGYIDDVDKFDATFFNMLAREAEATDPQQRLLLETSWHTLEDAGIKPSSLAGSRTGVFIGIASSDYARLYGKSLAETNLYSGIGNAASIAANRISYFYNLKGPSLAIDTACSSSLVAVHQACAVLNSGECDLALAGGVNLILDNNINLLLARGGMLSTDGKCKAFDKLADGYVRGEGCGLVVLKRLADALKDEDNIVAVISGSAVNQDGRSNGITAPNGLAQESLLREALEKAEIAPNQIGFIEAHGTGTSLGDPIEVNTLIKMLMPDRGWAQPLFVGSVKTNIGHLEAAAGIAGLIKTALCLKYGRIPANLHLKEINPRIAGTDSPLIFPSKTTRLPKFENTAYAGVSSFSFGGTNAHVILKDFQAQNRATPTNASVIGTVAPRQLLITLSAKNEERLKQVAASLREYILKAMSEHKAVNLVDLAFSLQHYREAMPQRLAIIVSDSAELIRLLGDFCEGIEPLNGVFYGNAKRDKHYRKVTHVNSDKDQLKTASVSLDLEQLAHLWTCGFAPDWRYFYRDLTPRRIELPPYPFERQNHWSGSPLKTGSEEPSKLIHPLLGRMNMTASLGSGIVFESTLRDNMHLLTAQTIDGRNVMPKVGFIEIAVAAMDQLKLKQKVTLKGLKWYTPLVIGPTPLKLYTIITKQKESLCYKIMSRSDDRNILHAKGHYSLYENKKTDIAKEVPIDQIIENCNYFIGRTCIYRAIGTTGLQFGNYFKVVEEVRCRINQGEALGILRAPNHVGDSMSRNYYLPLSIMNGAFQAASVLLNPPNKTGPVSLMLPYTVDRFELISTPTAICYAYARLTGKNSFDIAVYNNKKLVCLKMQGVVFREFKDQFSSIIYFHQRRQDGDYINQTAEMPKIVSISRPRT